MRRAGSGRGPRLRDLKILPAGALSLALLMQCGSVCLWNCLFQHPSNQHDQEYRHPSHRHAPVPQDCHHAVVSPAGTSGPAVLLAVPAPAPTAEPPVFAGFTGDTQPEPLAAPDHPTLDPDPPPPRG